MFNFRSYAAGVAVLTVANIAADVVLDKINDNKIKKEIQTTTDISAKDYNKIEQGVKKGTITWDKALDSLKTKSAVEKAYFQGGQAVRDSLANVAKMAKRI